MVSSLDPNEKKTIANIARGRVVGIMQTVDMAPHAAPSFWPG
jgi:hypothetical protein